MSGEKFEPGVVVASGGIDSTVLAYQLKRKRALRGLLFVNYGQATLGKQLSNLQYHKRQLGTDLQIVRLDLPLFMRGTGAILKGKPKKLQKEAYETLEMGEKELDSWMTDVFDYIPARNTFFILYALAWARSLRLTTVYTGFQFDKPEWNVYHKAMNYESPGLDTTPGYVWAFNDFLTAGAMDRGMKVEAPFLESQLDKEDIVALGRKLKVNLDKTYSCEFYPECGGCRGCLVRSKVLTSQGEYVG